MNIAVFAPPQAHPEQVSAALNLEDVNAIPVRLDGSFRRGVVPSGVEKCALVVREHGVVTVGEQVSLVRDSLKPEVPLIVCTPQPAGGDRRVLLECGASEIVTPQSWAAGHVAERVCSELILDGDIKPSSSGRLRGATKKIRAIYKHLDTIAPLSEVVLILGETGTGKELVAREIHERSGRPDVYIPINCPEISLELLSSELFGHQKGAFTGADRRRRGLIAEAGLGTVFLDEIGDLDLQAQAKLLRVLEDRKVRPVGSNQWEEVKARIVLATNRDLEAACREGRFRPDLYERIRGFTLHLPPLRERKADIPLLVHHFVEEYNREYERNLDVPSGGLDCLFRYEWPGNVRELRAVVRKAAAYADSNGHISSAILQEAIQRRETRQDGYTVTFDPSVDSWKELMHRTQVKYFRALLELSEGNRDTAIKLSGLSRSQFYEKWKEVQKADLDSNELSDSSK